MFFGKSSAASCSTLMTILSKYEKASGQCINKGKSSINFSSKTNPESKEKERVKRDLNISNEGGIGKYLGLPEHFGRRKRDIFASIVDIIKQKSHGWTTRFLSGAGKMVLLKTVLSSMPNYAMSCFKLPSSLCKQIQSVVTRFWWDSTPGIRKLCWVSWDKLTLPKGAGGLGFREIEIFNDALLAKHTWRILQDPTSLLARTLLNKYCLSSGILDCVAPNAASHGWRGISAGREIIKKGLGWVIGDGNPVNVWNTPWLSTDHQLAPMGPAPFEAQKLKVRDLLDTDGCDWNVAMIRRHLPCFENHIRKIIPSSCNMRDELLWLPEKSGQYSTKTGYALAKINVADDQDSFSWRKCVWNVKCSPKQQHFLWKLKNEALVVGASLRRRGMQVDDRCKRCGELETTLHVMFTCPFAKRVWDKSPVLILSTTSVRSIGELLQACSLMINLPLVGLSSPLYPWILWVLWTSRNQLTFEDKSFNETEIVVKAIKNAKEWQSANEKIKPKPSVSTETCPPMLDQEHLPENVFCCFSDGAWNSVSNAGGMGWSISTPNGDTIYQGSTSRGMVASALVAEALAVREAMKSAVALHLGDLVCYSDSKSLIDQITSNTSVIALKGILHDISVLRSSFTSISFKLISRICNSAADGLANSHVSCS